MGDYYQTIVDLDADAQSAPGLASRLRDWMISKKIIVPEPSDCVLSKEFGHAPGECYELASKKPRSSILDLRTNGAMFITKKTVFYACPGNADLVCSACKKRFPNGEAWSSAVGEWFDGEGPGLLACELCQAKAPIAEWEHDPPWAFGYLGVEFWNWPSLSPEFINEVGKFLGHRVRLVRGKI